MSKWSCSDVMIPVQTHYACCSLFLPTSSMQTIIGIAKQNTKLDSLSQLSSPNGYHQLHYLFSLQPRKGQGEIAT